MLCRQRSSFTTTDATSLPFSRTLMNVVFGTGGTAIIVDRVRAPRRLKIHPGGKMSPFLKSISLTGRRMAAAYVRNHSSLINQLIENMDKKAAWDSFYAESSNRTFKNFEWFFGFNAIRDFIMPLLQTEPRPDTLLQVLDMGCGISALGPCIYRHSPLPVRVTCADISPIAVRLMQEHIQAKAVEPLNLSSQLEFIELDCTQLHKHYSSGSVDLIVDKGTTDALLRSKEGKGKASLVLKQCLKALQSSGSLLQFSDEDPDVRLLWLETEAREQGVMLADVGVQEVGELRGVCYYCYQVTPRPVV